MYPNNRALRSMEEKIKIGIIPAAGSGSRLGYLSNLLPKTLFPVYDRPILHHIIDLMDSLGIDDIYIIINNHKEKIIEYYNHIKPSLRIRIHFMEQKVLNGVANALMLTRKYVREQPFLVILGDECLIGESLESMVEMFFKNNAITTEAVIEEKDKEILRQTCSASVERDGRIAEILEKPEDPPYNIRGCGIYLFKPEIFEYIEKTPVNPLRNEKDITSTINIVAQNKKAYGYFLRGKNININDSKELLKASLLFKEYYSNNK